MLREDGKPIKRVRVCGDLARYVDDEDLVTLDGDESKPIKDVVEGLAQVLKFEEQLLELEAQAA